MIRFIKVKMPDNSYVIMTTMGYNEKDADKILSELNTT